MTQIRKLSDIQKIYCKRENGDNFCGENGGNNNWTRCPLGNLEKLLEFLSQKCLKMTTK